MSCFSCNKKSLRIIHLTSSHFIQTFENTHTNKKYYPKGTTDGHILIKAQETCTILSKVGISSFSDNKKSIGRVLFNIEYFFSSKFQ